MRSSRGIPQTRIDSLNTHFQELFSASPHICRAPARVNLIGEHTDYNDGFVMPAAIERYIWVAAGRRDDGLIKVYSEHFQETVELRLSELAGPPRKHWSDYLRGVAAELMGAGVSLPGANLFIESDVPLGAGLSSSAALELSVGLAFLKVSGVNLARLDLVKLCQRAEHNYAGTLCGIMDQFVAAFGQAEKALMLDCRSLEYQLLPIPDDVRLVVCNSMVKHDLAAGEYNRRRAECEEGVRILRQHLPGMQALRDVSFDALIQFATFLPETVFRRCRHVVSENGRVQAAADALRRSDPVAFGNLMFASHESLRRDYEVSCRELDILVQQASQCQGVVGARMTGGGFGGCTVNLVRADAVEAFQENITKKYLDETGLRPDIYVCIPADGAGLIVEQ
jgi:galactokinase